MEKVFVLMLLDHGQNATGSYCAFRIILSFFILTLKVVPDVFLGVVLMEIAEAHKKVHNELEENVSSLKVYLVVFCIFS